VSCTETIIHDDKRYTEVWLTKAESNDKKLRESMRKLYSDFKSKKYRVVVFESGTGDLNSLTKDLIIHLLETSTVSHNKNLGQLKS